jgi:hypothetical protein
MKRLILAAALTFGPSLGLAQSDLSGRSSNSSFDFSPAGATAFVQQIFAVWSGADPSSLNGLYADSVDFYGSLVPASKVQDANSRFAQRWQTRSYTISSIKEDQCNPISSECIVSGVVHWNDLAPGPQLHSIGDASFSYTLQYGSGRYSIVGEGGRVIDRTVTTDTAAEAAAASLPSAPPAGASATQPASVPALSSDQSLSDTTIDTPQATDDSLTQQNAPVQIQSSPSQQTPSSSGEAGGILGAIEGAILLSILVGLFIYFLPTFVASWRRSTNGTLVFLLNLLLGWTLLGWIVALVIAALSQTKDSRKIERETLRQMRRG